MSTDDLCCQSKEFVQWAIKNYPKAMIVIVQAFEESQGREQSTAPTIGDNDD